MRAAYLYRGAFALVLAGIFLATSSVAPSAAAQTPKPAAAVSCPSVGSTGVVYDPADHLIYVGDWRSGNITIYKPACHLVATIATGGDPSLGAFNPANNRVYFVDSVKSVVYLVKGTKLVGTISSSDFFAPDDVAYDPGDGVMVVTDFGVAVNAGGPVGTNVTLIAGTAVVGNIPVGTNPTGVTYDPFYNEIVVANYGSDNVTLLNATYPFSGPSSNVAIPNPGYPFTVTFDPQDDMDYVTAEGSQNVTEISGAGYVAGQIYAPGCYDAIYAAWDQFHLRVAIDCYAFPGSAYTDTIIEVNSTGIVHNVTLPIAHGTLLEGLDYDDATHDMYVASYGALWEFPG